MAQPIRNRRGISRFLENLDREARGLPKKWTLEEIQGPRTTYPVVTGRCPRCKSIVVLGKSCGKCNYRGTSVDYHLELEGM